MVNEFEYCPRLFYLEWVQARFEDNPDTVEGRYVHRRVDLGGGRVGDSGEDEPVRVARSVTLGSERLGLIAKADIIEGSTDGSVIPVEVKRGRPPSHGPAWSPELVQLCAIGLLLQDNGYECTEGQIYFAETRRRVSVAFDEELISKTLGLLDELRPVAAAPDPPPPLIDSPQMPSMLPGGDMPPGRNQSSHTQICQEAETPHTPGLRCKTLVCHRAGSEDRDQRGSGES